MCDQRAPVESDEEVLGAAADVTDPLSRQLALERRVDGPAEASVAQDELGEGAAAQRGPDASAGGLDFREFGHGGGLQVVKREG
jgi:hypothetical protein